MISIKLLHFNVLLQYCFYQRGNPLLKSIRNVPWEYGDIVPDYVMGHTCCALFLSLRYHNLNPQVIKLLQCNLLVFCNFYIQIHASVYS
jgi:DNA repair protein Rad10